MAVLQRQHSLWTLEEGTARTILPWWEFSLPILAASAQVGFDCRETCLSLLGQSCLMGDSPWLFLYLCCCSFAKSYPTLCNPMNGSTPAFTALQLSPGVCSNSRPPAPVKGIVLAGKDVKNLNFQRMAGPWDGTKESSCVRDSPQKVDTPCCGQEWCPRLLDQNVQRLLGSLLLSSVQWPGRHPSPWKEFGCLRYRMEDSLTCLPQILSEGEKNCGLAKPL